MDTWLGIDLSLPGRAVVALVLVLSLIALTVWLMRRFGEGRVAGGGAGRNRQQRLAVLDSAVVDARRRLVLIRRDNVEHLILIGGPTDVVVEPNIIRAAPAGGTAARPARPGGFESDDDTSLIPEAGDAPPAGAPRSGEPPRTMPRPAPQRIDPQYADMAQRLEQALRKPPGELDVPRSGPVAPVPRAPEPRVPERPGGVPSPRPPSPRAIEPVRAPEPRPAQAPLAGQPAPAQQSAADVFGSLEEEMASLLRPGAKKEK